MRNYEELLDDTDDTDVCARMLASLKLNLKRKGSLFHSCFP